MPYNISQHITHRNETKTIISHKKGQFIRTEKDYSSLRILPRLCLVAHSLENKLFQPQ